jgi:hypothetical protein
MIHVVLLFSIRLWTDYTSVLAHGECHLCVCLSKPFLVSPCFALIAVLLLRPHAHVTLPLSCNRESHARGHPLTCLSHFSRGKKGSSLRSRSFATPLQTTVHKSALSVVYLFAKSYKTLYPVPGLHFIAQDLDALNFCCSSNIYDSFPYVSLFLSSRLFSS